LVKLLRDIAVLILKIRNLYLLLLCMIHLGLERHQQDLDLLG